MSIFSKLFSGKKEDDGRTSGVERFERKVSRPIIFMTEHGGSCPLEYDTDNEKSAMMKEESLAYLQKAIESGCIDEYTDLSIFYDLVRKRSLIVENELKNQNLSRKAVGSNIKVVVEEALCRNERKQCQLSDEMRLLSGVEKCRESLENEKGIGD